MSRIERSFAHTDLFIFVLYGTAKQLNQIYICYKSLLFTFYIYIKNNISHI